MAGRQPHFGRRGMTATGPLPVRQGFRQISRNRASTKGPGLVITPHPGGKAVLRPVSVDRLFRGPVDHGKRHHERHHRLDAHLAAELEILDRVDGPDVDPPAAPGEPPAEAFLYGLLHDASVWRHVVAELRTDHRLVAPTLPPWDPGRGRVQFAELDPPPDESLINDLKKFKHKPNRIASLMYQRVNEMYSQKKMTDNN